MDGAPKHGADHHPEKPRHITELGRKNWPDQGTSARNGREMVTEQDPFGHGVIIVPVAEAVSRCDPGAVKN